MLEIEIVLLDPSIPTADFDCGIPVLNNYLIKFSHQNQKSNISTHFVALIKGTNKCVGFYASSMATIEPASLPPTLTKGLPQYSYPAGLIGRLAADRNFKGNKIGEKLLVHAIKNFIDVNKLVGCFAVVVDAKNLDAENFYLKYGFQILDSSISTYPKRMYLPIKTAEKAF